MIKTGKNKHQLFIISNPLFESY